MKKIYITDLDHTFLRNDLSISDYTKNIWNSHAKSSIMGIATARTYKKTMEFMQGVTINAPMILLDGALIATQERKIIDTKLISKEIGDAIIQEGIKFGIYPFVISLADKNLNEAFLYSHILNDVQKIVLSRYAKDDNLIEQKNLRAVDENFKIVYMGDEMLLKALHESLESLFHDELKYIFAPEAYVGCYFLTILHKDADKSHGIKSVSEALGFDLTKLTVFGDNFNDVGMFALAGKSIAMQNAQEGVKCQADIVLEHTNDEDGVARYLEGLL
ncbi:MAG: HAD-IIB family hydrolase [Campylobacterales bacterium]|nr:HAD-IIB family hydrolase [Campylobacterales bacterium]